MPEPISLALIIWGIMAAIMVALWLLQKKTGDAGIVDAAWAAGLGLAALIYAVGLDHLSARRWIVAGIAIVWSGRLAVYILRDRVLADTEDGRYQALRERFGSRADAWFLGFFQIQAAWVVLFSIPMVVAMLNPATPVPRSLDYAGLAVAVLAIAGESLADRQLARFRKDPANKGRTCRAGLWRYSRHPNYFFEWLHWWAYVLIAAGGSWWWLTLLGPILMFLFLFKVTGIPYTEAQALKSRGDDYRRYQQTTSVFIPWPPKEDPA